MSSVAGQIGSQTDPPYSAAKAALDQLRAVRSQGPGSLRRAGEHDLPRHGADAAQPRRLASLARPANRREQRRSYEEWAGEKVRKVAPLGRWQTPEDIAALAVFLASPLARNITGQAMNVDGGQVMHW